MLSMLMNFVHYVQIIYFINTSKSLMSKADFFKAEMSKWRPPTQMSRSSITLSAEIQHKLEDTI